MSFDPTGPYLLTETGRIEIDLSPRSQANILEAYHATTNTATIIGGSALNQRHPKRHGYGISLDKTWITCDGENMLWLPSEYRPRESAMLGQTICIGCQSGRVIIISFSRDA